MLEEKPQNVKSRQAEGSMSRDFRPGRGKAGLCGEKEREIDVVCEVEYQVGFGVTLGGAR